MKTLDEIKQIVAQNKDELQIETNNPQRGSISVKKDES
jgi:hypothetical protein